MQTEIELRKNSQLIESHKDKIIISLLFTVLLAFSGCGLTYNTDNPDTGLRTDVGNVEHENTEQLAELSGEENEKVSLGDIDGDGTEDYALTTVNQGEGIFECILELYFDDEMSFSRVDKENYISVGDARYLDLDMDGEKEIFVIINPRVNSAALVQYTVLKNTSDGWIELENTDASEGDEPVCNSFPISVCKGEDENTVEISCDGCQDTVIFDYTDHYTMFADKEDSDLCALANDILYTDKYSEPGTSMGETAAWGIWQLSADSIDGQDCIVATHGIQGLGGKEDYLGTADVYFNYDESGKIKILKLTFTPER